ncbi:MAG: gcdC [Proteobacteria bacterium]|nr:gcdC [Pseudomonadota bacterium]
MNYSINIHQKQYEVEVDVVSGGVAYVIVNGEPYEVYFEKQGEAQVVTSATKSVAVPTKPKASAISVATAAHHIIAPIPGLILDISVKEGDAVKPGQVVVVIDAMKMENKIVATEHGTVRQIHVDKGAQVGTGHVIMVIE